MAEMEYAFGYYYPPRRARVHEVFGTGAYAFSLNLCSGQKNAVIWIHMGYEVSFHCGGFSRLRAAENIYFLHIDDAKTQAWCMEEALASSAVGLVVCERAHPVSFRDMRRLQLAAERGQTTGVFITSKRFANPAAETRWECTPLYSDDDERLTSAFQNWALVKNKRGVLGDWKVRWDDETHRFSVV